MNNLNVLMTGGMGSGKTQLTKRLLSLSPRAVVLDPEDEYEDGGIFSVAQDPNAFARCLLFFRAYFYDNFHIIYRGPPDHMLAWMDIVYQAQRQDPARPITLVTEEASRYSSSHKLDEILDNLYTKGRRARINIVTNIQYTAQIHPIIRNGSHLWIALRNKKSSAEIKQAFIAEEFERIRSLEPLTPDQIPVEGTHYLVDEDVDLFGIWSDINT